MALGQEEYLSLFNKLYYKSFGIDDYSKYYMGKEYYEKHGTCVRSLYIPDGKKHRRWRKPLTDEEYQRLKECVLDKYPDADDDDIDTLVKSMHISNGLNWRDGHTNKSDYDYVPLYKLSTKIGRKNYEQMNYDICKKLADNFDEVDRNGNKIKCTLNAKNGKEIEGMMSDNSKTPLFSFQHSDSKYVALTFSQFVVCIMKIASYWTILGSILIAPIVWYRSCILH